MKKLLLGFILSILPLVAYAQSFPLPRFAGVILQSYTVASLPACNSTTSGDIAAVTDATAPTYNGALTGGGTVHVPVFCNGTSWTSH
jgi:hypothetical protein